MSSIEKQSEPSLFEHLKVDLHRLFSSLVNYSEATHLDMTLGGLTMGSGELQI